MGRKNIDAFWDRNNVLNVNDNFVELYDGVEKVDLVKKESERILTEAKTINNYSKEVNDKNVDVQTQLNGLVIESGNANAEVSQARGLSNTLRDEIKRVDTKTYTKNSNGIRPMVSFYLDDGYQNDYDIVYPKAKELGIPVTICLFNTSALLSTPERLTELTNEGWEIHSHTATHAEMDKLTLEQQKKEIIDNIVHFKGLGYDLKGICYPKGYTNSDTLKASREYLQVGMSSIPGIN